MLWQNLSSNFSCQGKRRKGSIKYYSVISLTPMLSLYLQSEKFIIFSKYLLRSSFWAKSLLNGDTKPNVDPFGDILGENGLKYMDHGVQSYYSLKDRCVIYEMRDSFSDSDPEV